MGNNVIGFYDSGVGGLSVLKVALNKIKIKTSYSLVTLLGCPTVPELTKK